MNQHSSLPAHPTIDPDDLQRTALNIDSILAAIEDYLNSRLDSLDVADYGHLIGLQTARENARYLSEALDIVNKGALLEVVQ